MTVEKHRQTRSHVEMRSLVRWGSLHLCNWSRANMAFVLDRYVDTSVTLGVAADPRMVGHDLCTAEFSRTSAPVYMYWQTARGKTEFHAECISTSFIDEFHLIRSF